MDDEITQDLFECVRCAVERVCQRAQNDHTLVVTEADLQSWLFVELVNDRTIRQSDVHIHTQINYLKEDDSLGHVPDIVLLPSSAYSVDPDGEMHNRKGYTVLGSSIAIELKLLRSHRRDGFVHSVEEDLSKLKCIRELHYTLDHAHRFFAVSVVLCRQPLFGNEEALLRKAAEEAAVELWIFNKTT